MEKHGFSHMQNENIMFFYLFDYTMRLCVIAKTQTLIMTFVYCKFYNIKLVDIHTHTMNWQFLFLFLRSLTVTDSQNKFIWDEANVLGQLLCTN